MDQKVALENLLLEKFRHYLTLPRVRRMMFLRNQLGLSVSEAKSLSRNIDFLLKEQKVELVEE